VLYAVPTIALNLDAEFLSGAVLAVLVLGFLRLEKLKLPDARLAAWLTAGAAVLAMAAAPALDEGNPWFDYESWALEAASSKTTSYTWDHTYGPLDWPRDGREMLRVRARHPAYWKAENLDVFDGLRWIHQDTGVSLPDSVPPDPTERRDWTETVHFTVRNLRSDQFVTGGYATAVRAPGIIARQRGDGTYLPGRLLGRGDAYSATIYSPQPTQRERHLAPPTDDQPVWPYLRLLLPRVSADGVIVGSSMPVDFPRYGEPGQPRAVATDAFEPGDDLRVRSVLGHGPYAAVWRLSQRLKRGTNDEEDYVESVLAYLGDGFSYTESPPRAAETLPGFLLRAKTGYCQQFSGGMALLLRMGGVPARVATGFTSGALDRDTGEYVVRDLDAHSWVEAWFPDIGWVTFDPTPAVAPPRAQPDEVGPNNGVGASAQAPDLPGDKGFTKGRSGPLVTAAPWWRTPLLVLAALVALAVLAWGVWRARRPATPALVELERALRRTHRGVGPDTTLRALESDFSRSPAAAGYVRAVRDARYGGRSAEPTRTQRAALRHELARDEGFAGRLRAWWALPPL
jgi:protein-glutamine gamma-glutamyltransferase